MFAKLALIWQTLIRILPSTTPLQMTKMEWGLFPLEVVRTISCPTCKDPFQDTGKHLGYLQAVFRNWFGSQQRDPVAFHRAKHEDFRDEACHAFRREVHHGGDLPSQQLFL